MITEKELRKNPLEELGIYLGVYPAIVEDNNDPENLFRLKVRCPIIADKPLDWALPRGVFAGNGYGLFALPQKGDNVWVTFQRGDATYPIWEYGAIAKGDKPDEARRQAITIISKKGAQIILQEDGKIKIKNDEASLKDLLLDFLQAMQTAIAAPPNYTLDPNTQNKLAEIIGKVSSFLA